MVDKFLSLSKITCKRNVSKWLTTMNPLVSIIIPVYNCEKYLADSIRSALNQTYGNYELIVVNDGSSDRSLEIASEFIKDDVQVYSQENRGASSARNAGLLIAKGVLIQFLDADDILDPDKIRLQVASYNKSPNLSLIGGMWRRFDEDITRAYEPRPFPLKESKSYDRISWLLECPYMVPSAWLVPRKLIELAGNWNENLSFNDDGEFFYRIISSSMGVAINHEAVTYYRTGNASSLSNQRSLKAMLSWIDSIRSYKKIIHDLTGNRGNEKVDKFYYEVCYNCVGQYPELIEVCKSEMYVPNRTFNLSDNIVYYSSKLIGLYNARKLRTSINYLRDTTFMNYLISHTKTLIGWKSV